MMGGPRAGGLSSAGTMRMSMADWAKFVQIFLLEGSDLLSPDTVDRLLPMPDRYYLTMAMGWMRATHRRGVSYAMQGSTEHGVADRCEFRPGDFHTVPIEDGAYDIVVLGHICRTEGPDGARRLVERAYAALRPEGRIVLADYFIGPNHKTNPHAVLMGMTMMASTVNGFGVTTETATGWLRDAGFEALRLIEPIGFQFAYVASKPRN